MLRVASLFLMAFTTLVAGDSCMPKLKNVATLGSLGQACMKTLNVTTIPQQDDLKKNHFDDHCFANCTMTGLKLIVNNTFQRDAMISMLKENAPSDALPKLTKIVDECDKIAFKKHSDDHEHEHAKNGTKNSASKKGGSTMKPSTNSTTMPKQLGKTKGTDKKFVKEANKICKQAALFVHCYSEKEQKVC